MAQQDIIAVGGSTGAIPVIRQMLADLPRDFSATLFIVVHVAADSQNLLASMFAPHAPFTVVTAQEGKTVLPRHVYVAPAAHHLLVIEGVIRLGHGPRENR